MFKKQETINLPFYGGTGTLYVHDRTGMEVLHIKNDSSELCCCFMFATPSEDSMGVAHILEHTVLSGSGRFPVKDPFNLAIQSSPNTFMNAMTFPDMTLYPFASPLKKDFDNLFDVYADAVFNPLLRKTSFEQEGVRFFDSKFDGVVFNEMSGVRASEDEIVQSAALSKLFEGTPYCYDSGGDPYFIADLTYETYLKRYRKWYSPSNCRLFLYGDMDCVEYLEKIEERYLYEENLSRWDSFKIIPKTENYKLKDIGFVRDSRKCTTKDANTVVLSWLTTSASDPVEVMTANILVDVLLGNPGAPLYKAIIESDLGEDLSNASGSTTGYPYIPFTIGFSKAQKGKEDEIEDFLVSTLKRIAEEGLPKDLVQAVIKRFDFSIREIPGSGMSYGLIAAIRAASTWLRGRKPYEGMDRAGVLAEIRKRLENERYFESWILNNLVNNPNRCLLSVYEDPSYAEDFKVIMDEKLLKRKSEYTKAELEKQKKVFEGFLTTEDTEEQKASIKRICLSDMPDKVPVFDNPPLEGTPYPEKVEIHSLVEKTNGITYLDLGFDCSSLTDEEKLLLPLFVRLIQICNTKKHTYSQIGTLIRNHTGSLAVSNMCGSSSKGECVSTLYVISKFLTTETENALSLILEILQDGILKDAERIRAAITDITTDFYSNYLYYGNYFASLSSASLLTPTQRENEMEAGTSSFLYMESLRTMNDKELVSLANKLEIMRDKLFNSNKLTVLYCCEQQDVSSVHESILNMVKTLMVRPPYKEEAISKPSLQESCSYRVLKVSSGPSFNAMAFRLPRTDESFVTKAALLASILSSGYLWEAVRGKGGAYGVESNVNSQDKIFSFSSYRDPSVEETFLSFIRAFSADISEEEIENTVVTLIGKELKPMPPSAKSMETFRRILYGLDDKLYLKRRQIVLNTGVQDLREVAFRLEKECRKSAVKASVRSTLPEEMDCTTEVVEVPV